MVKANSFNYNQSTIEHNYTGQHQNLTSKAKNNYSTNQSTVLSNSTTGLSKKHKDQPTKTRSQSVSGVQKSAHTTYTPGTHRKGSTSNAANSSLLASQISSNNAAAAATLTAHYRCSTASSTNKERRSSQPPNQNFNNGHGLIPGQQNSLINPDHGTQNNHQQNSKQRSASSTNYQSAFLVKNLDGRNDGGQATSSRAGRQKSTRDNTATAMNSSLIQQLPQDRQFQSITHAGGANTSMLSQNLLQETIFNQSFNGTAANVSSRYQTGNHPSSQSNYNKRKQQVASINELLNVAETLKQSNYSMRPR